MLQLHWVINFWKSCSIYSVSTSVLHLLKSANFLPNLQKLTVWLSIDSWFPSFQSLRKVFTPKETPWSYSMNAFPRTILPLVIYQIIDSVFQDGTSQEVGQFWGCNCFSYLLHLLPTLCVPEQWSSPHSITPRFTNRFFHLPLIFSWHDVWSSLLCPWYETHCIRPSCANLNDRFLSQRTSENYLRCLRLSFKLWMIENFASFDAMGHDYSTFAARFLMFLDPFAVSFLCRCMTLVLPSTNKALFFWCRVLGWILLLSVGHSC